MNAEQTREAIRGAMAVYERTVLAPRYWNAEKAVFQYPYRVSEAEVLRIAGIRSRSTLVADYHAEIKIELATFIAHLKERTGKGRKAPAIKEEADRTTSRLEQFAQTIAAQDYKIRALEQELQSIRSQAPGKVTNISDRKK